MVIKNLLFTALIIFSGSTLFAEQSQNEGTLFGNLKLDQSWDSKIYLSYIPTFNDMYMISTDMIISETSISPEGDFEFDLSFLPDENHILRLHITKKEDAPASLVIGGNDENHLFLIANRYSVIELQAFAYQPPLRHVNFSHSNQQIEFHKITSIYNHADSIASGSSAAKRRFIENKLYEELIAIADTSSNPLISLYAIYKGNFESNYSGNMDFYRNYSKKWNHEKSAYFQAFRKQINDPSVNHNIILIAFISIFIFALGFFIGKNYPIKKNKFKNLSIQERKIFDLLKKGATNQEISDEYNIEVSTVKSHVSSIFSKLKIKSRKEIMNIKD
ncbi:MAG TPA: hypothetical protein DCE78_06065 [Bacteroidetes bacterium]|nr:hypothetical protein [Bacteroidota bacterium]